MARAVGEALESRRLLTAGLGESALHLADAVQQVQAAGDGSNDLFIVSTTGGYSSWASYTPVTYNLSRIHADGQAAWTESFSDRLEQIVTDHSGGVWAWSTNSDGSTHMLHLDASGQTTVDQPYETPYAVAPGESFFMYDFRDAVNHQNQLLDVFETWGPDSHRELLRIYDSNGNLIASRSLDALGLKYISSIAVASDDSIYLGGTPTEEGGACIAHLTEADAYGYIPAAEKAESVAGLGLDAADNLYVAYSTATGAEPWRLDGPPNTPSEFSTLVVSYDANSAWRWQNDLSIANPGAPLELHVNAVGDVAVSYRNGMTAHLPGGGTPDGMAKLSSDGQLFWTASEREISAISLTDDGRFFACVGNYSSIASPWDPQLLRYSGVPDDAQPNLPPEFPNLLNTFSGDPGSLITATITATDPDGGPEPLRYSLQGDVPAGARIDAETGVFSWTPDTSGRYQFNVAASDGVDISTTGLWVTVTGLLPVTFDRAELVFTGTAIRASLGMMPQEIDVDDWGVVQRSGKLLTVDVEGSTWISQITLPSYWDASHEYPLGDLPPGDYTFTMSSGGNEIASIDFSISATGPWVIRGTDDADTIEVTIDNGDIVARINGTEERRSLTSTTQLSILGGDGNDTLVNQTNVPCTIYGGAGDDRIVGGSGADFIDGGDGANYINGGPGKDTIIGGVGNDTILAGREDDSIVGGGGVDLIQSETAQAWLDVGTGVLTIVGSYNDDQITIAKVGSISRIRVRTSDWTYLVKPSSQVQRIEVYDDGGNDRIEVLRSSWRFRIPIYIEGGVGNDTLIGGGGNDTIIGGTGDDSIHGRAGRDSMSGGDGNDSLYGGGGNDTLDGATGDDVIYGQMGNDLLHGDEGADQLWGGQGRDALYGNSAGDTLCGGMGVDWIEWDGARGFTRGRQEHDEELVILDWASVIG